MNEARKNFRSIKLGLTTCYLLGCRGGYLLIDTSYPQEYGNFKKAIRAEKIEITEIKYLLLTHHHHDHGGFVAPLLEESGATLITHKSGVDFLEKGECGGRMKAITMRVKIIATLFKTFRRCTYPPVRIKEKDIVISGGENISDLIHDISLKGRILHTPGHSRDSISVLLDDGTAFVGDAAMNIRYLGPKYKPIFMEDTEAVIESWRRLLDEGAETIYPAHGRAFPASELRAYI